MSDDPVKPNPKAAEPLKTRTPRPGRLTHADYEALGSFRRRLRLFLAFSEEAARSLGLTPQQHQALLAIKAHPGPGPMTVGELAECLLIRNHSAVGLVSRMVERGLVVRDTSTADRRRVVLFVTPLGEQMLETISRKLLGELRGASDVFTNLVTTVRRLASDGAGG